MGEFRVLAGTGQHAIPRAQCQLGEHVVAGDRIPVPWMRLVGTPMPLLAQCRVPGLRDIVALGAVDQSPYPPDRIAFAGFKPVRDARYLLPGHPFAKPVIDCISDEYLDIADITDCDGGCLHVPAVQPHRQINQPFPIDRIHMPSCIIEIHLEPRVSKKTTRHHGIVRLLFHIHMCIFHSAIGATPSRCGHFHIPLTDPAACIWLRWRPWRAPTRHGCPCTT